MKEQKTYTEEEMNRIVEFSSMIERIRVRALNAMHLAIQRATAAGDTKESIASLQWIAGNIEVLVQEFIANQSRQPEAPAETPAEPAGEPAPE